MAESTKPWIGEGTLSMERKAIRNKDERKMTRKRKRNGRKALKELG